MVGSNKLKVLAISDTHLGEEISLLSFPRGLQHLWHTLAESPDFWKPIFPDFEPDFHSGKLVEVEDLVLLGDIVDRTLSSTSQISNHAHAFTMMLGSALNIERGVYVPGNHDHTLWTDYLEAGRRPSPAITGPEGERVVEKGRLLDKSAEELLSTFFGYPAGWAWWTIGRRRQLDFAIANPVYAREIGGRTYVFTHGTHFREELVSEWQKTFFDLFGRSELDQLLNLDLQESGDLDEAKDLADLEGKVAGFVDSLWPSSRNKPTSRSDELWYLITLLREGSDERREPPQRSEIFSREGLRQTSEGRINNLTDGNGEPTDGSLERCRTLFLPHLKNYLEVNGLLRQHLTFAYGDTHRGGWGELTTDSWDARVRVYNCGGWVVEDRNRHPACQLFAVTEDGEEYLLDISFGEGVKVGDDHLLDMAADDVEHRRKVVGRGAQLLGRALRFLK